MFCESGGDGAASIIGFGPVKRDAEKCTTGTTRHAWIQIAHFYTILKFFFVFLQRIAKENRKNYSPKLGYNYLIL
ncbi:hypothetical protein DZ11F43_39900 [Escherichia coli]